MRRESKKVKFMKSFRFLGQTGSPPPRPATPEEVDSFYLDRRKRGVIHAVSEIALAPYHLSRFARCNDQENGAHRFPGGDLIVVYDVGEIDLPRYEIREILRKSPLNAKLTDRELHPRRPRTGSDLGSAK